MKISRSSSIASSMQICGENETSRVSVSFFRTESRVYFGSSGAGKIEFNLIHGLVNLSKRARGSIYGSTQSAHKVCCMLIFGR